jgi:hypothetical protein
MADASRLMAIPAGMDFNTAAAFILTYGTSDHALADRGELKAGETLLVLGASGGVGLAAVEIGKALGARVIACASTPEKLAVCEAHGADATINYTTEDLRERIKELTGGKGIDVVYDAVGGPYTEPSLRSLAWRGRLLVVGFAAGDSEFRQPHAAQRLSIVGLFWGDWTRRERASPSDQTARPLVSGGKLKPHVSERCPSDVRLRRCEDGIGQVKGVLTMDRSKGSRGSRGSKGSKSSRGKNTRKDPDAISVSRWLASVCGAGGADVDGAVISDVLRRDPQDRHRTRRTDHRAQCVTGAPAINLPGCVSAKLRRDVRGRGRREGLSGSRTGFADLRVHAAHKVNVAGTLERTIR